MADADLLKVRKDALVAALTQLSNAAQDASRACIDFYAAAAVDVPPPIFAIPAAALQLAGVAAQTLTPAAPAPALAPAQPASATKKQKTAKHVSHIEPRSLEVAKFAAVNTNDEEDEEDVFADANSAPEDEEPVDEEDAPTTSKKRGRKPNPNKKVRDPNAPRRPQTVYFAFANETRKQIRDDYAAKHIEASNTDIIREVAERWKNMSDEAKEPWKTVYAEQIKLYETEKAKYLATNPGAAKQSNLASAKKKQKKQTIAEPVLAIPSSPPGAASSDSPTKRKRKHKKDGTAAEGAMETAAAPESQVVEPDVEQDTEAAVVAPPRERRKRRKRSEIAAANAAAGADSAIATAAAESA
ncbi:uncharacterized protein V1518DRAFT_418880 [Limtongia smithiae]|uniref:uncharacterized protein n=1 Tax=Limtongia smithiae TaxID=1125753 RepID=UPI0034CDBACE